MFVLRHPPSSIVSLIDNDWPREEPEDDPSEFDDEAPLELDDQSWDALLPEDDYEPQPEPGDFWPEVDDRVGGVAAHAGQGACLVVCR